MQTGSHPFSKEGIPDTYFANPDRDDWQDILCLHEKVAEAQETLKAFNALPDYILILNKKRQTVFANSTLLEYLGNPEKQAYLGKRPGELFNCTHASENEGGCGCAESCKVCGAVKAILGAANDKMMKEECQINRGNQEALDLRVWSRPFEFGDQKLILFTFSDISSEKRRQALESIFFHDVINTAGSIRSIAHIMSSQHNTNREEHLKSIVRDLSDRLLDEIQAQRILSNAEHDELAVSPDHHDLAHLIDLVIDLYRNHEVATGKHIQLNYQSNIHQMETDSLLFTRVLGNMLKNALEATDTGETVTITVSSQDNDILLQVHNNQAMPRPVQLQVFNRSFSTKGPNRGLGTYSMKMIGEKYLKGRVSFVSTPEQGTTFSLKLPIIYSLS